MLPLYNWCLWIPLIIRVAAVVTPRDDRPGGQFDPNTTSYCSWWQDNDGSMPCSAVPEYWGISLADFLRWVSIFQSLAEDYSTDS